MDKLLNKLESRSDIKWSQVLDVSIDNIDDLYTFLVTFVFNFNPQAKGEKVVCLSL